MADLPPDAALITGPVGSGKTEAALDAIMEAHDFSPFSPVWVLLPTGQQIHAFQDRLVARSPDAVQFGIEFFSFEALYIRLLDLFADPQRLIDDTVRYQIVRAVVTRLKQRGELALFGEIAEAPGFVALVAGLIHELKQGLVSPERFAEAVVPRGPKDQDLALIYAEYQEFLRQRRLVDRHGAGWLAIAHLERGEPRPLPVDLLVVDGFDQFNRVHSRLLTLLARRVPRTVLTLAEVPGRRFRRFEQTRDRLLAAGMDGLRRQLWRVVPLRSGAARAAAVLDHLAATVFHPRPAAVPVDDSLSLIEAPDVLREVGAVLRAIKRRLLEGTAPDEIIVIAHDMELYSTALRETARIYGVPLVVREGLPLKENPAVALLLALIDLDAFDFPRRDTLDTLRSPYLHTPDLTPAQVAALERISLARQIVRGRETWLFEVGEASRARRGEDGEEMTLLGEDDAAALADALARHFERITPPTGGTVFELARWLEDLIGPDPGAADEDDTEAGEDESPVAPSGGINLLAGIRAAADPERAIRDLNALHAFKRILHGLCAGYDVIAGETEPPPIAWAVFRAELGMAVESTCVQPPGGISRRGRVLATSALEARGLPHPHVYVLGLSEGVFPAQETEPTLYGERDRAELEQGNPPVDMLTAAERADDASLFYQAVGLARRSLTLSRFTVDDTGSLSPASPYWHAVRAAVAVPDEQIVRIRVGAAPGLDDCATPGEVAVAVSAALSGEHAPGAFPLEAAFNALSVHPVWAARWANVQRGRAIEARREHAGAPFDGWSGVLTNPALIAEVRQRLGPGRVWSASQFGEYGVCAFRFFARRLLRLEAFEEPEEGPDVLMLGSINHAILEHTYRRIAEEGWPITAAYRDRALHVLEGVAAAVLDHAPEVYGFRRSPLWAHERDEMVRRLGWLVQQDFGDGPHSEKSPLRAQVAGQERQPYWQEAEFGFDGQPPLVIDGPAGPVRVRGKIDRLDRCGDAVVVMDYKTGSAKHPVEDMREGRDFQMMVYLLAARDLLAHDPALDVLGGLFWHIRTRTVSGEVLAEDPAIEQAREHLHAHVLAARDGIFAARPNPSGGEKCAARCDYSTLCRLKPANRRKSLFTTEGTEIAEER